MGLGALGIVQGYVLVMLLVAMYTAYTSTPEGAFNPLFMDSRMLTVTNAFIAIGGDGMVTGVFAGCGGVADSGFPIFIVFAAAVCYDEYAIWLLLTPINRSMHGKLYVRGILQPMMLSVAAVCPLLYCFLVGYAAPMKIASSILSVLSIATGWARFMIVVHGDIPPQDRKPSQSLREEQVPKRPLEDKKLARPPPPPSNPSPRPPPFNPSVGPTPNSSGMRALFSMAQPLHYDGRAKNA